MTTCLLLFLWMGRVCVGGCVVGCLRACVYACVVGCGGGGGDGSYYRIHLQKEDPEGRGLYD